MGKTKVELIRTPSYKEAGDILNNSNSTSEYYLRNLITEYIGTDKAEEADYEKLRYYWHVIRGVSEKIIKSEPDISAIEKKIQEKPEKRQLELF